ncbi:DUF4386 family protein [Hyalangium versicolor]|uniref:DUF4386 family protein n=1 Tax=Hyalangium versicolor TaxID=2861190 RepID=UPI001CCAE6D5|nr:DUF4386 family protein [Hyalangium versicolor]
MFTRNLQRVGAIALVLGAAGFVLVFFYLHAAFDYPAILSHGAGEVLPRLAAGGATLRAAWLLYSALPLTLLFAGIASMPLLEDGSGRGLARLGAAAAVLAAVTMMLGLLRWPSIHDALASSWASASADHRELLGTLFDAANRYLGNLLGELLGELSLAGWFACIGFALWRSEQRTGGALVLSAAAIVAIGALRQLTSVVAPIAEVGNVVLPLGLFLIAGFMFRTSPAAVARARADAQPRS